MSSFSFIDWLWLFSFLALMVGCGLLFYRLGKRSESDFFLAGRGLPWWLPATSVYATRDLYHHYINPKASEKRLVWVGRFSTVIVLLSSFAYGMMMTEEITKYLLFALWIMAAGVWLPNILQVVWWRFNSWAYLSSWIANLVASWLIFKVLPDLGVIPVLKDYYQFWILMGLCALVYIPITFLTKPEDMNHLVKFYVMARPLGWWGPVREEAERKGLIKL